MKRFASSILIRATPQKIWQILTDLERWPSWNTTVDAVEGTLALGQKITVRVKLAPGQAFPVKVAVLDEPERMVWRGGMPLAFLFKGERSFSLVAQGSDVEFRMEEIFDGWLAGMITKSIPDLQPAFDEFASCLKAEAEKS